MDQTDQIVVTRRPPGRALAMLAVDNHLWLWKDNSTVPREVLLEQITAADGLYCMLTDRIDEELLDAAPRLRAISTMAVGTDNIDLAACAARGIPVGHTPDVLTETTADTAFALLLSASRRIIEGVEYVRDGKWRRWEPDLLLGHDVHGTTLGIVGLGRIGRAIAKRGLGFGMGIVYHNRRPDPEVDAELHATYLSLAELLAVADHVVVATPLTDDTHHLIDTNALAGMKPTATLVNIARGPVVDPKALFHALRDGVIAAAGLDVTDPEPIPPYDPLLDLPNCVIIPHLGSSSLATRAAMAELAAENLLAGLAGAPMPSTAIPPA